MTRHITTNEEESPAATPLTGNRCGHDPLSPRWFEPPPDHGDRPPIIRKWIDRVKGFYHDPGKIPSLANVLFDRRQASDPDGDHKPRQMRSERREACCSLLGAIAHYCDLPSLCLSVPQPDGTLLPIRMETLAERAGLSMRRAERAMRDIVDGGLLAIHRRCEQLADGSFIGRAAIRVIPPELFGLFGLQGRLEHDRRRISQQRTEERRDQLNRTGDARMKISIRAAMNRAMGREPTPPLPTPAAAQLTEPSTPSPARPHSIHIAAMKARLAGTDDHPATVAAAETATSSGAPESAAMTTDRITTDTS